MEVEVFAYCEKCRRSDWFIGGKCMGCGVQSDKLCSECGVELEPHEKGVCSQCASSKEYIG